MNKSVIIVAGGSGSRMNVQIPKQFLPLGNSLILMQTIMAFYRVSPEFKFVLALPENQIDYWKDLCLTYHFDIQHDIVVGGEQRFFSVQNALQNIEDFGLVAVHDGVRPLVSKATIDRCFAVAEKYGNAIPGMKAIESIRKITHDGNLAVDRSKYVMIQTPQVFQVDILKEAYLQPFQDFYTDDASVVESFGVKINLVEGNAENIKITTPNDLVLAEALLKSWV